VLVLVVARDWSSRSSPAGSKIVLKLIKFGFGSKASGVVETETEVWTADKQPVAVALLAKN
jgi:hypothetical protein